MKSSLVWILWCLEKIIIALQLFSQLRYAQSLSAPYQLLFVTYVKTFECIFPQPNSIKSACVETDVLIRLLSLGNQAKIKQLSSLWIKEQYCYCWDLPCLRKYSEDLVVMVGLAVQQLRGDVVSVNMRVLCDGFITGRRRNGHSSCRVEPTSFWYSHLWPIIRREQNNSSASVQWFIVISQRTTLSWNKF